LRGGGRAGRATGAAAAAALRSSRAPVLAPTRPAAALSAVGRPASPPRPPAARSEHAHPPTIPLCVSGRLVTFRGWRRPLSGGRATAVRTQSPRQVLRSLPAPARVPLEALHLPR